MQGNKWIGTIAAALLGCGGAHADETGPYVGVGFGEARQTGSELSDADTSYQVVAGYAFSRFLSVEAAYIDAGTLEDTFEGIGLRATSDGVQAALIARLPVHERIAPYARLGYVWYDTTTTFTSADARVSESASEADASYGFGCEFRLGERFRLRGQYEYIDVPDVDFDLLSLVAVWQF
jgi:hypothetical protein